MVDSPVACAPVDVLVPTYERPGALAVTLAGLAGQEEPGFGQEEPGFRIVVSDQSRSCVARDPLVAAVVRILRRHGHRVEIHHHLPRRGVTENRAHLLSCATAPLVLFLDDDVWLEPWGLGRLREAIEKLDCGFVGFAVQGLSYLDDHRPHELAPYEEWQGAVTPERLRREDPGWQRWTLHNAANPTHLGDRLGLSPGHWRAYKIAWIGGCVLFRRQRLEETGGFSFWSELPPAHAGEEVVAQLRVMQRYGGAGILPSGAVHLELPTTVPNRDVECYDAVDL